MNPFEQRPMAVENFFIDWNHMRPQSYDKRTVDPYTRTRVILMNGTEFENVWFSHQYQRNEPNNDIRRELALMRRQEQQQQKLISVIKPADETLLEHTIGYEQLAVDLTAELAQREPDPYVKKALDFALLEDFDHLYRYANLLDSETGEKAENLVGRYTEIMPGRPTIAHHRHPFDSVRRYIDSKCASPQTRLAVGIITGAEQQTMNYYMNVSAAYPNDKGRWLYQEIGMVEEQHVTHYGSLLDVNLTWLENLLMRQYIEAYLYYSCVETETDDRIRRIWERMLDMEIAHLHRAADLLRRYENKDYQQVCGKGDFPAPLSLHSNIDYVRRVLGESVQMTAQCEDYECVNCLAPDNRFFAYQSAVNSDICSVQSHVVIDDHIQDMGSDYRFEVDENPIPQLRDRTNDNLDVGRTPNASDACNLDIE